ncbi:hypothetical protein [Microbacterium sp. GXF7504]
MTDDEVRRMRAEYAAGATQRALADAYGVAQNTVSAIVTGRNRSDAGGPIAPGAVAKPASGARPRAAKDTAPRARPLSTEQVEEILSRSAAGDSRAELAAAFGVSVWTIDSVRRGATKGADRKRETGFADEDVRMMRRAYAEGATQTELAAKYGTSQQVVSNIVRGRTYGGSGGPIAEADEA